MRIIYDDGGVEVDEIGVLAYINEFTRSLGIERVIIDDDMVKSVLQGLRADFPHKDGLVRSSIFKKLANFITYFVAQAPIKTSFAGSVLPLPILDTPNHQNAVVAFHIAIATVSAPISQVGH